ncbi:MAG TPA: Ig domain-containing protein [Steroidobacteraceae bacterium]|nr:Ig domain-containing protein [Steroidobacteraceae bacterium]
MLKKSALTGARGLGALLAALAALAAAPAHANFAPGISGSPPKTATAGSLYTFGPYSWDKDGDKLTLSVKNKPAWMTVDQTDWRIRGTPTSSQVGVYRGVTIQVSDGTTTTSLPAFDLTVYNADGSSGGGTVDPAPEPAPAPAPAPSPDPDNIAPGISGSPPTSVKAGGYYTFGPYSWDKDGDKLTLSVANKPAWMTVDQSDWRIRGTPTSSQVGVYRGVTIQVSDGKTTSSLPPFDLTVLKADCSSGGGTVDPAPAPAPEPSPSPEPAPEPVIDGKLFVKVASPGSVPVTLHPGSTVLHGSKVKVAFGVPFPQGLVSSTSTLRVVDASGVELPSYVVETARWRGLGQSTTTSVRSALFYIEMAFTSSTPRQIAVQFGRTRTKNLAAQPAPDTYWVGISRGPNPNEYPSGADIREPAVYATLPADWMGATLLRGRTQPVLIDSAFRWFDEALINYAETAVNDVSSSVSYSNLIDYDSSAEPWLFDRAMTLFGVYVRTGELRWLRHAHRAAQFYAKHVSSNGSFDLKSGDLKYSYGQSMFLDLMLTGDRRLVAPIERVAGMGRGWQETYSKSLNFWTERHQAYALLAALSAWEATGKSEHASRAIEVARATFTAARQPPSGWSAQGCVLHTIRQHEGDADDRPICSPWMSALLGEAVWRYYLVSRDSQALGFLSDLGNFIARYGIRDVSAASSSLSGKWAPWYLASSSVKYTDSGAWGDMEHTCDVAGLTARAGYAARALGRSSTEIDRATQRLVPGCQWALNYWHRTTDATRPEYRLQPPRKFSWWFGSTLDLPWLVN